MRSADFSSCVTAKGRGLGWIWLAGLRSSGIELTGIALPRIGLAKLEIIGMDFFGAYIWVFSLQDLSRSDWHWHHFFQYWRPHRCGQCIKISLFM